MIFPKISETFVNIGILFLFLGLVLMIIGVIIASMTRGEVRETKVEGAFIGFIGPIPIVIGTSKQAIVMALLFFIAVMLLWAVVLKRYGVW